MQNQLLMDILEKVQAAQSLDELLNYAAQFSNLQGFRYFSFGHRSHASFAGRAIVHSSYPDSWFKLYAEHRYEYQDPVVLHGLGSSAPLVWTADESFNASPAMKNHLLDFDLKCGWSQSTRSKEGISIFTLADSDPDTEEHAAKTSTPELMWFTQLFNTAIEKFLYTTPVSEQQIRLTSRETDVTRWTADGKTSYEISIILGISERTVNFHLNNMMAKLNANNRISATIKAITLGLV